MGATKALSPDVMLTPVQVELGAMSHVGKVRDNNEDHYLVATFERSVKALLTNVPEGEIPYHYADTAYGLLVADGMGGTAGGEVASRTAISTLIELALRTPDWIMRLNKELANEVLLRMSQRIERVEATLTEQARLDPDLTGMGTTITVACSLGTNLLLAHVGDSRAYLFRGGKLYRLTRDHTLAQALADLGVITPQEAESHPMRHLLTQAVGPEGRKSQTELNFLQLADEDQLLLCTDGLTDMVSEAAITALLALQVPATNACRALVEAALEAGGLDNITVVLARYHFAPAA